MIEPIVTYCNCMEDVKTRLAVIRSIVSGYSPLKREDFDSEVVCLHLRKILEQIAFASLSAHKDVYAQAHSDFTTHWNAKRLLTKLGKLHPDFYPKPVRFHRVDEREVTQLVDITDGFLTKDEFVFLYDKVSEALHVLNPFKGPKQIVNFDRSIAEWLTRIQLLLSEHWIRLIGTEDVWFVQMHAPENGKVHACYMKHFPVDTRFGKQRTM